VRTHGPKIPIEQMFTDYVQTRGLSSWKFWIVSLMSASRYTFILMRGMLTVVFMELLVCAILSIIFASQFKNVRYFGSLFIRMLK